MTEFYHNLLMQALSKSNYEITLDFTGTSKLVKKVNFSHQKMVYKHKKSIRKQNQNKIKQETKIRSFFVNAIIENEKIEFPEEYFKMHNLPQKPSKFKLIKNKKQKTI